MKQSLLNLSSTEWQPPFFGLNFIKLDQVLAYVTHSCLCNILYSRLVIEPESPLSLNMDTTKFKSITRVYQ